VFCKKLFENLLLFPPFLGLLVNIDVFCRKILKILTPSSFSSFLVNILCVLQNYLAPGNFSNLSFLAGTEQLIYRTPPLTASTFGNPL